MCAPERSARRRLIPLVLCLATLVACEDREAPTAVPTRPAAELQAVTAVVVNSLLDQQNYSCAVTCTLRDAISTADMGGTITFSVTGTITLALGELLLDRNLTIVGPGASNLTVNGDGKSRVFRVLAGVTAKISGMTITGGNAGESGAGGGIVNFGTLTLDSSVVSFNRANTGAGIANASGTVLTVTRSSVIDNRASFGGGISNGGTLTVAYSTVARDSAAHGGGIFSEAQGFTATILQSTVSGNKARYGSGIQNDYGTMRIVLSTITGNTNVGGVAGDAGAGVLSYNDADTETQLKGSVVWGNTKGATPVDLAAITYDTRYVSLGYNLIGAAGPNVDFSVDFKGTGDQTGVSDAKLGALASNGGPTQTHELLSGSPAIDAGTCVDHTGTTVTIDQRGVARPQPTSGSCDKGAYELQGTGKLTPAFTFSLSTLPAKTYGNGTFSVAGSPYVTTNSTGAVTFALGAGSVGCSVSSAGVVTITGAATGTNKCIITATLAPDATYIGAGPVSQSFNIAKAMLTVTVGNTTFTYGNPLGFQLGYEGWVGSDGQSVIGGSFVYSYAGTNGTTYGPSSVFPTNAGTYSVSLSGLTATNYDFTYVPGTITINRATGSVSINNIPTSATSGDNFTPTYAKSGDGVGSVTSSTPTTCYVTDGVVYFAAAGTCTLVPSVAQGTNHLAATGSGQSFTIAAGFSSSCTYTINAKNDQRSVVITWENAAPGVTLIRLTDGRVIERQMAPTASGSWSTKVSSGTPTYELLGGESRKDSSTTLKSTTACTPLT